MPGGDVYLKYITLPGMQFALGLVELGLEDRMFQAAPDVAIAEINVAFPGHIRDLAAVAVRIASSELG